MTPWLSIESHGVSDHIGVIFVEGVFLFLFNGVVELAIVATVTASHIVSGFCAHMRAF
jgi:hypothetical protein